MKFTDIQGNADVVKALAGMVDSSRIPHAIMLHEDDGGGAVPIAHAFLQYLYCQHKSNGDSCGECPSCNKISKLIHPDIRYIFPVNSGTSADCLAQWRELVTDKPYFRESELGEALGIEGKNSMIKVDEAKGVLDTLAFSALERGYRTVMVYLPEKMNREAANRLLKSIEEPPALTEFILITHDPDKVLPTIKSRCLRIRVAPPDGRIASGVEPEFEPLLEQWLGAVASKDLLSALDTADAIAALPSREKAAGFCAYAAARLRYVFLYQQKLDILARVPSEEEGVLRSWAAALPKAFVRKATEALGESRAMIEHNVSVKIVFTDLTDKLYIFATR